MGANSDQKARREVRGIAEIAAECLKMFRVSDDVAEAVATRTERFVNRYALTSSVVCEISIMCS